MNAPLRLTYGELYDWLAAARVLPRETPPDPEDGGGFAKRRKSVDTEVSRRPAEASY